MNNEKLMKISWVASILSITGIILNAYMVIWCWPVWILANTFWIYWSWKKREIAQVILWIAFEFANIYGWYMWASL